MEKGWLKSQLPPAKQGSQMWADFMDSFETLLLNYPEKYIDRLKARLSLFESDTEDLETKIHELGDFFLTDAAKEEDLPFIVMQREDQVHFKRTTRPLISTLLTEFNGLDVTWEPLYAPKDQAAFPYGSLFAIERELDDYAGVGVSREDFFLTSRGVIRLPMNQISQGGVLSEESLLEFEKTLERIVYPLIPLRIVNDGQRYYMFFSMDEGEESISRFDGVQIGTQYMDELSSSSTLTANVPHDMINITDGLREPIPNPQTDIRMDAVHVDSMLLDRVF